MGQWWYLNIQVYGANMDMDEITAKAIDNGYNMGPTLYLKVHQYILLAKLQNILLNFIICLKKYLAFFQKL